MKYPATSKGTGTRRSGSAFLAQEVAKENQQTLTQTVNGFAERITRIGPRGVVEGHRHRAPRIRSIRVGNPLTVRPHGEGHTTVIPSGAQRSRGIWPLPRKSHSKSRIAQDTPEAETLGLIHEPPAGLAASPPVIPSGAQRSRGIWPLPRKPRGTNQVFRQPVGPREHWHMDVRLDRG